MVKIVLQFKRCREASRHFFDLDRKAFVVTSSADMESTAAPA